MKKNILWYTAAIAAILFAGSSVAFAAPAQTTNAAASNTKTPAALVGKSKFVISGTVVSASATMVTVAVTSASKNMAALKKTTQNIPIATATKVTKKGKKVVDPSTLSAGAKVKIFGIYDRKNSKFVSVRWIKVL